MAVSPQRRVEHRPGVPAAAWPSTIHPADVTLAYDPWPLDTLHLWFSGRPEPGYYVPVEPGDLPVDGLSLKIAMDGGAVLGLMVEGYLADGLSRPDAWVALAHFAGVPPETLMAFGLPPPEGATERDAAVTAFLTDVRAAWESIVAAASANEPD